MYESYRIVVAAVIFKNGEFLLAKRHKEDSNLASFWSLPAGHIEVEVSGIDTLENNLQREVKEEVGVDITNIQYLDSHCWVDPRYKKITVVYTCEIATGEPTARDETDEVGWFRLDDIAGFELPPNVYRVLEKAVQAAKTRNT